jgi:hypothetical protein
MAAVLSIFAACSKDGDDDDDDGGREAPPPEVATARCAKITASIDDAGFDDVEVTCDDTYANIVSNDYPDHDLMNGITGTNEQIPVPAPGHSVPIPLAPVEGADITTLDGALGVAVNGVPIYDYSAAGALDVDTYDPSSDTKALGQLDDCGGHAGRGDDYHYHAAPTCMMAAMRNKGDDAIIGWGFDGYPIYGDKNPDGTAIGADDLDKCNGQADDTYGHRYHTSAAAPYIVKCLLGEVDTSILTPVSPLSTAGGGGGRPSGTPPDGGVEDLEYTVISESVNTLIYTYEGESYYIKYSASETANCYNFETKTVTDNGEVKTGEYCR